MNIVVCILILVVFNSIFLGVYCRFSEKMDKRSEQKRQECIIKKNKSKVDSKEISGFSNSKFRKNIAKLYFSINSYTYGWMRYNIVITGKIPSNRIRNLLYRAVYNMKITNKTVIYGGCEIRSPWNIYADRCVISSNCILDGRRGIIIGEDVVFGGGVHIWTEEHDINDPDFSVNFNNAQPVIIENHVWICSDSTILPGVTLKEGSVIATRAVVTKNCDNFSVYGGVPAKIISSRAKDLRYKLNGKPTWHFF